MSTAAPATQRGRRQRPPPLPVPPTSLVGREREIAAVHDLLRRDGVRLVTVTGPPGVGKTRLALAVADRLAARVSDGVYFVPLAAIDDPDLVVPTFATTLGVPEIPGQSLLASAQAVLRGRRALLVLDNFEQLLASRSDRSAARAEPLVVALLASGPHVKALVTSRAVLRISGEHDVALPPLSLPGCPDHGLQPRAPSVEEVA